LARYQPALLGGLFIGILSSLPVIGVFNACCCLWVVSGGVLTTYLMQQNEPQPIETSTAALSGLIAGSLGGLIAAIASSLFLNTDSQRQAMDQFIGQMGDVPPEMLEMFERFTTGPAATIISIAVMVPLYGVFGLLGGLLGLAFFRKKAGPEVA